MNGGSWWTANRVTQFTPVHNTRGSTKRTWARIELPGSRLHNLFGQPLHADILVFAFAGVQDAC